MKIYNGNQKQERRHKHYIIPIIYMLSEIIVVWLILSFISLDFYIKHWNIWIKLILTIAILYSITKTFKIYNRQKNYKRKGEN